MIPALLCLSILAAVLWYAAKPRRRANDSQPTAIERLAQWERRMGEHRAQSLYKRQASAQAFDQRASVQPKVSPKLPKDNIVQFRKQVSVIKRSAVK